VKDLEVRENISEHKLKDKGRYMYTKRKWKIRLNIYKKMKDHKY